jgi:NAD(P)H-nitrite reductase large subunit
MRYLIVGNSATGIFAAETIRGLDPDGQITMISKENCLPYSRCLTSYFLGKEISEEMMYIRDKDYYSETGIDFQAGNVERVDADSNSVLLDSGEKVTYDKLLIATGSSPFCPPLEGSDLEGVFQLRTLDDAKKMAQFAPRVKDAVVIGAGLVGLKGAHGLHDLGINVTVVEFATQIMPQSLDAEAADMMTGLLRKDAYRIDLNSKVVKILGENLANGRMAVSGVVLDSGEQIPCQMVLMAVGVRSNVGLVKDSGVLVNKGIIVDEKMQTAVENIYAAGDVAETYDILWGERRLNALWPMATAQGIVAGCNMAGVERCYEGSMGLNSAVICGVGLISAGIMNLPPGEGIVLRAVEPENNFYRKFVIKDGRLVGMIMVGKIEGAGVLSALIRKRAKIDINYLNYLLTNPVEYLVYSPVKRGGQ